MANDPQFYIDQIFTFERGMDSGISPLLLEKNKLSFQQNATVRGAFITHRPPFRKVALTFESLETQTFFENGLWQGGCYYKPDSGSEFLVASIGGRLFTVIPTAAGANVVDVTTGQNQSSTASQCWLWQSEKWVIWQDGVSLPVFFDGSSCRRSLGLTSVLAITDADFIVPAQGATVDVLLTEEYTGPTNIPVTINGELYQLQSSSASSPNASIFTFYTDGSLIPVGSEIIAYSGRVAALKEIFPESNATNTRNVRVSFPATGSSLEVLADSTPIIITGGAEAPGRARAMASIGGSDPNMFIQPAGPPLAYNIGPYPVGSLITLLSSPNPDVTVATVQASFTPVQGTTQSIVTSGIDGLQPSSVWIGNNHFSIEPLPPSPPSSTITLLNINATVGATVTAGAFINSISELPAGRMGAYGLGRTFMSLTDGRSFIGGDIVGSSSGTPIFNYRDSVLRITENNYLSGGGVFIVPGNTGDIRAMIFPATLDVSLGQGALQVFTPLTVFSVNAPVDRSIWQTMENPILTQTLISNGALSHYGTVLANGDTLFRAIDGIRSLILARREFSTWGNTPISHEMERVLARDSSALSQFNSAVVFSNRYLTTSRPIRVGQGVLNQGIMALNFDPISSLAGKQASIWDGLWTGLNTFQLISGVIDGVQRAFAFGFKNESNVNELYELTDDGLFRFDSDVTGDVRITWSFETACLFKEIKGKGLFDLVKLQEGEFYLGDVVGTVDFQVYYRPQFAPCWVLWHSGSVCAKIRDTTNPDDDNVQPQNKVAIGLGTPKSSDCDPINNRPYIIGETFQFKFVFTGSARFYGAVFKACPEPKRTFAPVKCDAICVTEINSDCEECKRLDCVGDDDYELYTLQDRFIPVSPQVFFNQAVYFVKQCFEEGAVLVYNGTLPSWITLDAENNRLVGASGIFQSNTQSSANALAQNAMNEFGNSAVLSGDLECNSDPVCLTLDGTISLSSAVVDSGMIATGNDDRRAMMLLDDDTFKVVNTDTNAVISSGSLGTVDGDTSGSFGSPIGCYATSVQKFFVPDCSASPARSVINIYTKEGVLDGSINVGVFVRNCAYSASEDRIYASASGWVIHIIDPNTETETGTVNIGGSGSPVVNADIPGKLAIVGSSFSLRVYNLPAITLQGTVMNDSSPAIAYAENTGKFYASRIGIFNTFIREVNPSTLSNDFEYSFPNFTTFYWIRYIPSTGLLIAVTDANLFYVINPLTRETICTFTADGSPVVAVDSFSGKVFSGMLSSPEIYQ